MSYSDLHLLNRLFDRMERYLPEWSLRSLRWLRTPSSRWLRVPLGLLLIAGSFFSFLPVLGLWMLPLGLLFLAIDVPMLRRPTRRGILSIEQHIRRWKHRHRARHEMDR